MIELRDIRKSYKTGDFTQQALDGVSMAFRDNEFVAILGPSGSGKTTLLNVLGGLDHADSGEIVVNGVSTREYRSSDWDTYRNHRIGFVFQSYNLIPHQTVLSNVELALTLSGVSASERRERAQRALERVGLGDHVAKRPAQLSGGQMQRVAIARALVNNPDIVLADEPTGALDGKTGVQIMDLLREVANDRLVIMVTHNPELAEQYATRIVQLADGRITDDSMPFSADDVTAAGAANVSVAAATPAAATVACADATDAPVTGSQGEGVSQASKKTRKASMSFLTALELSFNNLMTKKGRTFLTAFAGSIGIIGIAAILALSNGVNSYIDKTEKDAMSSYPLSITQSSANFMGRMMEARAGTDSQSSDSSGDGTEGTIPVATMVSDMFASVHSNDLGSFKKYLDGNGGNINDYVSAITYDYGVAPHFYQSDPSKGTSELGSPMGTSSDNIAMSAMSAMGMTGTETSFQELVDDKDLLSSQYDMVAGRWPEAYDECVLVLGHNGRISDYTLYAIGVLDPDEFTQMMNDVSEGKQAETPDEDVKLSYDDALKLTFSVVEQANLYKHNDSTGTWTSMSSDKEYMTTAINNGIKVKVVGVISPNDQTTSGLLEEGVAYSHELTEKVMADAADSEIARQQKANPDVDVFTGKTFEELQAGTASAFDMGSLFSVDQDALRSAFSFDASKLQVSTPDLSGLSLDTSKLGFDPSSISLDASALSGALDSETILKIMAGAPEPDLRELDALTAEDRDAVQAILRQIGEGFLPWWFEQNPGASVTPDTDFTSAFEQYLQSPEVAEKLNQIAAIVGNAWQGNASDLVATYLEDQLAPYLSEQMGTLVQMAADAMAQQLGTQLQAQIASASQSLGTQLSSQIAGSMQSSMQGLASSMNQAFSVDPSAFASAIHFNMSEEDLRSLMTSYSQTSQLTYDNNMRLLGCADVDNPTSISIYPKNFECKEHVLGVIDGYNDSMRAADKDDQTITYTDIMGTLLTSVTDIINTISLVLIAFVSISLVVSSIMIGIITYISVLERKKEIGILRAMGASRRNVANVFNAETFIEGLMSGVFAVAVVELVSVPVNAWVLSAYKVPDIMQLSPTAALVLVLISIALTCVAGLIPASKASRRDPVEALRSE